MLNREILASFQILNLAQPCPRSIVSVLDNLFFQPLPSFSLRHKMEPFSTWEQQRI